MSPADPFKPVVALEAHLKGSSLVQTLGVRPNWLDYNEAERRLILGADRIYYPSSFYAELFQTLGISTFPHYHNYLFAQDKIRQTALFALAGIPHPRTRIFYGKGQKRTILDHFDLPLVAKQPRGSALGRGVRLVRTMDELENYCQAEGPAYIQEYLPIDRDMRIVVIGQKVRLAYWRVAAPGDFHNNISAGGRIDFDAVPEGALKLALHTAKLCRWDDVGLDICECRGAFFLLEGNMKYGHEGFRQAGIDYLQLMTALIRNGEI
jgi:ribosomal protein S6--L-glutamate ligase